MNLMSKAIQQFQANVIGEIKQAPKDSVLWNLSHEARFRLIDATINKPKFRLPWTPEILKAIVKKK